ncbi:nucleotide-diphospho-sugar transferase [Dyadobacter arcticus]|uniref:Uncharacterized protein n=1 Tax=Dyadobacter arcticus TaxID=1078754 RepID=A0ABX0ULH9_9BACT|nr:nucleotide-diphospho-sugar transferase [Dyadobacter arcticus]NIJ53854.1 hypothetical protein [Dyadobacter arcticus]
MDKKLFDIPILLITFNKPEITCHVFEQIRKIKPSKLFLFSDAPATEDSHEAELVETCRYLLDDSQINWPCKVERWFPETKIGNAIGIPSAITWAFETCDKLIILEDDCLPHPTFFAFCKFMLDKYESNDRVMHISGTHRHEKSKINHADHFFSRVGNLCGWATWKRAWNKYDFWMELLPEMKSEKKIQKIFGDAEVAKYWHDRFDTVYEEKKKHTWEYQWQYTLFQNDGLAVVPNVNLVSNIGIDDNESEQLQNSYNFNETKAWKNLNTDATLSIDNAYEIHYAQRVFYKKKTFGARIVDKVRRILTAVFSLGASL